MKTVLKFGLRAADTQRIKFPAGAKILKVDAQYNAPVIWALVDTEAQQVSRTFHVYGTGATIPQERVDDKFIGTVLMFDDTLVFHVFEQE